MSLNLRATNDPKKLDFQDINSRFQKKIVQNQHKIRQSQHQLQEYIGEINNKVEKTIDEKLNAFQKYHQNVLWQKNMELKQLNQINTGLKGIIEKNDVYQKLNQQIRQLKCQNDRLSSVLEIVKKDAERSRKQIDMLEKELKKSKNRQKTLLKNVWVLEEDIKDIYEDDSSNLQQFKRKSVKKIAQSSLKVNKQFRFNTDSTERSSHDIAQMNQLNQRIQNKYAVNLSLKTKSQNLCKKVASVRQYSKPNKNKIIEQIILNARSNKNSTRYKQFFKQDIYEDLRKSIRQINPSQKKIEKQIDEQTDARSIKISDYELVVQQGPEILKSIQKIVIKQYGCLKQLDIRSIYILQKLFDCKNALKILEIILFSYSAQAINKFKQIKCNQRPKQDQQYEKEQIVKEQCNFQPLNSIKNRKKKIEMQIRMKFKNNSNQKKKQTLVPMLDLEIEV